MTMTPLTPRTPYIAVPVASLTTWMDSMSYGEIPDKAPFAPGVIAIPSITYKGALLLLTLDVPLMRTAIPPSDERVTQTPGYLAASWSSIETLGERAISSAVTVVAGAGFGDIGSTSPTGAVLDGAGAQASTSPITGLSGTRERTNDSIIGEI